MQAVGDDLWSGALSLPQQARNFAAPAHAQVSWLVGAMAHPSGDLHQQ
jgi:hypothetical protein